MRNSPPAIPSAMPGLRRFFPFLDWPSRWSAASLRADVQAGIAVALVMLPQSLAYAQLAGLPPHTGLYAALLPPLVGALFGSCGQLSTGPVALSSLLTAAALGSLAARGSEEFIALAVLLALLAGLIQLGLGVLRLGWLLNLLSLPVLRGFTNAAALLICLSQLPPLLGLPVQRGGPMLLELWRTLQLVSQADATTLGFGGGSLLALALLRRLGPRLPAVPLVVAVATGISAAMGHAADEGAVVGHIPAGLPTLALPALPAAALASLLPVAFVVALVSFMEAASSARAISARTRQPWDQNQELIGQGLAKLAGALSGTQPVSASFSRSALNYNSGAASGLSSVVAAGVVLTVLLWFSPWLYHLPVAVLAAVIMMAVVNLIEPAPLLQAWRTRRDDGLAGLVTFAATLAFAPNIQNGILTGLLLSLALLIYRTMRPRVARLALHPDGTWRDADRFDLPPPHPQVEILRFDGALDFVSAATFEEAVLAAARRRPEVRCVVISAAAINAIDATGVETLTGIHARLATEGQTLALCGLKQQVIAALERAGRWPLLAAHGAYRTEAQALAALCPAPPAGLP